MKTRTQMVCLFLSLLIVALLIACNNGGTGKITPTPEPRDTSGDTSLSASMLLANELANTVQSFYTNPDRTSYTMTNTQIEMVHELGQGERKLITSLKTRDGLEYLVDTMDVFIDEHNGQRSYASAYAGKGRMNTTRLGYYYYESHIRDLGFGETPIGFKLDKTFHTYPDKLHQEYRFIAEEASKDGVKAFGYEMKIAKDKVAAIEYKDKNGSSNDLSKIDAESVEYFAFDIKDVGVIGIIIPSDGSSASVTCKEEDGYYILEQLANLKKSSYKKGQDEKFGNRLYTDQSHSFDGIAYQTTIERYPLLDIEVDRKVSNARFFSYDSLVGAYRFDMAGTGFSEAYSIHPDKHFRANISVKNNNYPRDIYIWMNTSYGGLEAAAILDDTETLIPIPLQVCKNFAGEKEEPFYDPNDPAYGDTFLPIRLGENEALNFSLLNLYQNWGKFPLKQISSIQFHISYYHLSTGVTESNCIAPYFVYAKDGWTLPDFRGASGKMWASQPQFNSVGRLYFPSYMDTENNKVSSEYTDSYIRSAGLSYIDMDYSYLSDCGSYKYTLRHFEYPQLDENRTYYTLDLEFLKDLSFENVMQDFTLFKFDNRFDNMGYKQVGYLNEKNEMVTADTKMVNEPTYYKLGDEKPYFSYFDLYNGESIMNFGFILVDRDITMGGKAYDGALIFKDQFNGRVYTGTLTLDLEKASFKKGDTIKLDFILLPYGSHEVKNDENVRYVREDSALKPLAIEAIKGTVIKDTYLPIITCVDNEAEFTITGGRNNNAVRIEGFTNIKKPSVYEKVDGNWVEIELSSENAYDGYSVFLNVDGTYSFAFVFNQEGPDSSRTFKINN